MSEAIASRLASVQSQLGSIHVELRAIAELVDMFDTDTLDADTEASVLEVIDSLADAGFALARAEDPLNAATHHARLLP